MMDSRSKDWLQERRHTGGGEGRGRRRRRRECDDGCRDGGHDGIRGCQFFQEANLLKQICLLLGCIFEVTRHLIVLGLGIPKS